MRAALSPAGMAGLVLLSTLTAPKAPAQETARAIVERAIAAHGGADRLSRLRADKVSLQGKILIPGKDGLVPFSADLTLQLPNRFKQIARMNEGTDKSHTIVQIVDADKILVTIDSQPQQLPPSALAELRAAMELQRAARLVPLLSDPTYQLTMLGEEKVNARVAMGIKVARRGQKEFRLYFDQATGLLIKTEHSRDDGSGKEVLQEEFYGDFKDFTGFRRWTRIAAFRDGKKVMEAGLTDVKYLDKIDDAEFTKP